MNFKIMLAYAVLSCVITLVVIKRTESDYNYSW